MEAVLADYRTAAIPQAERVLFAFLEKGNREAFRISEGDVEAVRRAGWTDEAIYDAINVCSLFNFYNRWVDATGVHELPAEEYVFSGKRLAQRGYALTSGGSGRSPQ